MATITLDVAGYFADGASQPYAGADDVTIADTGDNLASVTSTGLDDMNTNNVDFLDATDDVLLLEVDQFLALNAIQLTTGDLVTIFDFGTNIAAMSATEIASLATSTVDAIDAFDDTLSLSKAQIDALGVVTLSAGDENSMADTSTVLEALLPADFAAYKALNVNVFDATDNSLTFTQAEFDAVASVTFGADDVITITGKHNATTVTGTTFADSIDGGEGKDTVNGSDGDDTINGGNGKDVLNGEDNDDSLSGGTKQDSISGGDGDDTLAGGSHHDILTGGAGVDTFLFDEVAKRPSQDLITDFVGQNDVIALDISFFTGLAGVGTLTVAEFFIGKEVHDADDRIVYNPLNGRLYYDADGTGRIDKIRIATIGQDVHPTLANTDITVVA